MRNYNEEIRQVYRGEAPRWVPFTIYPGMVPRGEAERRLRERGLSFCQRAATYTCATPDVRVTTRQETHNGALCSRTIYETPVGALTTLSQPGAYGSWRTVEYPVKTLDDYAVAEFMARNRVHQPAYEGFLKLKEQVGADGYVLGHTCYSPLMEIEVSLLGVERFCTEIIDHEAEVMSLYDAILGKQREMFRIVAKGPSEVCLYGGNIMPETLGPRRIEKYIFPCWQEFSDLMHEAGKMLGVHLDADNKLLLDIVARSGLDLIEAFTPPPDCDTGVAEARRAWPGKVLSVNFPSSVHLRGEETIRRVAEQIINEAGDRRGFMLGITEDVPHDVVYRSLSAILDVVEARPLP